MDRATVDHLLTTTRSVRKRLDLTRPVEPEIIQECLDIAIQAPTGSNAQGWYFLVVTDAQKRAQIGALYKKSWDIYAAQPNVGTEAQQHRPDQMDRVRSSAGYLAEHFGEVPVFVIPSIQGRTDNSPAWAQAGFFGSILPATWSLMLALRARGLGCAWTTLHLRYERETADILGIPATITQAALLPIAYYTGDDFKPAERLAAKKVTYWDHWGTTRP
jgi:nitroreductase